MPLTWKAFVLLLNIFNLQSHEDSVTIAFQHKDEVLIMKLKHNL